MSSVYHRPFKDGAVSYLSIPVWLVEFLAPGKCLINIYGKKTIAWWRIHKLEIRIPKSRIINCLSCPQVSQLTSIKWDSLFLYSPSYPKYSFIQSAIETETAFIEYLLDCGQAGLIPLGPPELLPTLLPKRNLLLPSSPHPITLHLSCPQVLFIPSPINPECVNFSTSPGSILWSTLSSSPSS